MTRNQLKKQKFPDTPGVYFFLGKQKEILYIGKATSLRNRIQSYFSSDIREKRSELIENMVLEAHSVEYTETDSVLEALILETNLIRTHKPHYNTRSKDDKSYNHLIITKEEYPRVLVVRGKDVSKQFTKSEIQYEFGPFPSGQLFREALKIVRKLFQFYDTKNKIGAERSKLEKGRIDFNRQIGLYPKDHSREEYLRTIRHIRLFFQGKKKQVVKELTKEMMTLAKREEFEEADRLKKRIFSLNHIQDVALLKNDLRQYHSGRNIRIEAYDIAHLQGSNMVGVMTVVEGGQVQPHQYRKFTIKTVTRANDTAALKEILERRFTHIEWPLPQLVVIDGGVAQKNIGEKVLASLNLDIPLVAVVKDEKHNPIRILGKTDLKHTCHNEILLVNSESHRFAITFHRHKRRESLRPKKRTVL